MFYSTGSVELDELIGRFEPGTMVLIEGAPGAGKTTLALSIAHSNILLNNSRVLYIVFGETPSKLSVIAKRIGFSDVDEFVSKGILKFNKIPFVNDVELINYITKILSEAISEYDIVIIDSVTPLTKILSGYQAKRTWVQMVYDFISKFSKGLVVLVADSMNSGHTDEDLKMLEFVSDVVIDLDYKIHETGFLERILKIKKYRGKALRVVSLPFLITSKGITVLSYIRQDFVKKVSSRRKPIELNCYSLEKIFGSQIIEPGTQVLIIDKRKWVHGSHFLRYFMQLLSELISRGLKIKVTSFNPELLREFKNIIMECKYVKDCDKILNLMKIHDIDPRTTQLHYFLGESCIPSLLSGVDVAIVLGSERLFHIYGSDAIKGVIINMIEYLRKLGVTTLRYMRIDDERNVPQYYVEFHDVVVALEPLSDGAITVKLLKNVKSRSPIAIPDIEFKECLKT
ncbi:hypothetical protein J4526_07355 [Desulfurococcaceae archaeon MEX13E-LK6-19]|nr:hypothetical protein J4526_07355 [Desulfurococcaceae archaeon MEX13E-LK6-19]